MRLNRFLAQCGVASRRAAEQLIVGGQVRVNGKPARELATQVEPGKDRVEVNGKNVEPAARPVYLLLNKPRGYDVTRGDRHSHRQVYDLLPKGTHASVKAVGRLDRDSTGLLLLTNDGALAHRLTHPSFGCPKTYQVAVEGRATKEETALLMAGVQLDDGPARAVKAQVVEAGAKMSLLRIVMHEGRKRIVRRMCEAIGHPVAALERTEIGPLKLGQLRRGQVRALKPPEMAALRRAAGMEQE
jgi:pseudouridine synthase